MQEDVHVFQGMKRATHPIKQDKSFLWDAHNIRLTSREGESMLSITNERSTLKLIKFSPDEDYIGHCTLGKYAIIFTHSTDYDRIYRIELSNIDSSNSVSILYQGILNLDKNHPIQAIGDFESDLIQKVYWVDGKNSPRVINIVRPELEKEELDMLRQRGEEETAEIRDANDKPLIVRVYNSIYTDSPFGFIKNLDLNEKVTVTRTEVSNGMFPSGVIQYAFTYYHKYGQETNIFDVSELLYISYNDRGGSPEDSVSTAFNIKIENIQENIEYLRIYSILRTSIDATPTVKRVTDIEINGASEITYTDNGTTGDIVDPTMLLYLGGKDIVAGCIASKDNILFLGDIRYNRTPIDNVNNLKESLNRISVTSSTRRIILNTENTNFSSGYKILNQLGENTSTFKKGETYRLGLQFQHHSGEWSEPLFVKDEKITSIPTISGANLNLPTLKAPLSFDIGNLIEEGYVRVRPLIVKPEWKDRSILTQGILCPTVFQAAARESNAPFSQSSWLLRPFSTSTPGGNILNGSVAEFRHFYPLITGLSRSAEIQNMFIDSGAITGTVEWGKEAEAPSLEVVSEKMESIAGYKSMYFVDQSVVTLHSPDIEFNESLRLLLNGTAGTKIRIVGVVPFNSNYGDINIQTSAPVINPDGAGFVHRGFTGINGAASLISGLYYEDARVDDGTDAKIFYKDDKTGLVPWLVHLWHRSGSLNNDCVRPEGVGTRTSVLKKKVISNLKYSNNTEWLSNPYELDIDQMQVFDSNEITLTKLKDSYNKNGDISYYGNVDSMNPSYSSFRIVTGSSISPKLKKTEDTFSGIVKSYSEDKEGSYRFTFKVKNISGSYSGDISGNIENGSTIQVYVAKESVDEEGNITTYYQYETRTVTDEENTIFSIVLKKGAYTGYIQFPDGSIYPVSGNSSYIIQYTSRPVADSSFNFESILNSIDPSNKHIGDFVSALKLSKDPVRIKYKSTPHLVMATKYVSGKWRKPLPVLNERTPRGSVKAEHQWWINDAEGTITPDSVLGWSQDSPVAYLWLAEVYRDEVPNRYGSYNTDGTPTEEALRNNLWIVAGPSVRLEQGAEVQWQWGDTWYQRYDVLKTYPFTTEDENQVVEIGSFMCETRTNIDGRYDRNRGLVSNLNISPINFNLLNPVYSQLNTFFNYRMLDKDYYKIVDYPSQLVYSMTKSPAAIQDTWTNLHMASTLDLDGANGKLVAINPFNDLLIGFQETSVQQILFNSRVQVQASDGVPIEIANNQKVEGTRTYSNSIGCQDKFSIVTTPSGIYFIDNLNNALYKFNGNLENMSLQLGTLYWPRENYSNMTWRFSGDSDNAGNNGIRLSYDSKYQDVYFIPGIDYKEGKLSTREALCFSEQLSQFTSMMSYGGAVMFSHDSKFYSLAKDTDGGLALWENFAGSGYNEIFGVKRPFSFSFISNDNPTYTKIFDTIEMRSDQYDGDILMGNKYTTKEQEGQPLDYISVSNEYQRNEGVSLTADTFRKKFRVWRLLIPRNKNSRERIRNPWAKITLGCKKPGNELTILHDLSVKYTL